MEKKDEKLIGQIINDVYQSNEYTIIVDTEKYSYTLVACGDFGLKAEVESVDEVNICNSKNDNEDEDSYEEIVDIIDDGWIYKIKTNRRIITLNVSVDEGAGGHFEIVSVERQPTGCW